MTRTWLLLLVAFASEVSASFSLEGALGVAATAALSAWIYDEPVTALMGLGIVPVVGGVLVVELGSLRAHAQREER